MIYVIDETLLVGERVVRVKYEGDRPNKFRDGTRSRHLDDIAGNNVRCCGIERLTSIGQRNFPSSVMIVYSQSRSR